MVHPAKRSYFLQTRVLQGLLKVLFSFLKKRGHPEYASVFKTIILLERKQEVSFFLSKYLLSSLRSGIITVALVM